MLYPLYTKRRGILLLCPVFYAKRTAMHLTDEFGNLKGQKQKRCWDPRVIQRPPFPFPVFL